MPAIDPNVQQWFMAVDTDRSGRINMMELQQALGHQPWARFGPETCRLMISQYLHITYITFSAFIALTLLVGRQEEHLACKQ